MRKFIVFLMAGLCLTLASCSKENLNVVEDEYVTVKLTPEMAVNYEPLTKAASNSGLYGVQIFRNMTDADRGSVNERNHCYAYGVFDDMSNVEVTFKKGSTYEISIDYIGADIQTLTGSTKTDGLYIESFQTYSGTTYSLNKVNYSTSDFLILGDEIIDIGCGNSRSSENTANNAYDRYCGRVYSFVPSDENEIKVNMAHAASSLKITLTVNGEVTEENTPYLYFSNLWHTDNGGTPKVYAFVKQSDGTYTASIDRFTLIDPFRFVTDASAYEDIPLYIGTTSDEKAYYNGRIRAIGDALINATYTVSIEGDIDQTFNVNFGNDGLTNVNITL